MARRKKKQKRRILPLLCILMAFFLFLGAIRFISDLLPSDRGGGIVVCLDPGHGGSDSGCTNGDLTESEQVLALALAVRDAMERQGIQVIMTREDDTFVELSERPAIANRADADYFISLHRNSLDSGDASGIELWTSHSAGETTLTLAGRLEEELIAAGVSQSRGCHTGSQSDPAQDYAVCRLSRMPAVLIEMGFITSKEDNRLFEKNQSAYAQAITEAVLSVHEESVN